MKNNHILFIVIVFTNVIFSEEYMVHKTHNQLLYNVYLVENRKTSAGMYFLERGKVFTDSVWEYKTIQVDPYKGPANDIYGVSSTKVSKRGLFDMTNYNEKNFDAGVNGKMFVDNMTFFPWLPDIGVHAKTGTSWKVKLPPVIFSYINIVSGKGFNEQDAESCEMVFKVEDKMILVDEVLGEEYTCFNISYKATAMWVTPDSGKSLKFLVEGETYFNANNGIPIAEMMNIVHDTYSNDKKIEKYKAYRKIRLMKKE